MGKKKIQVELSAQGIDRALKELEEYKKDLIRKTDLLREKIAEKIAQGAEVGFIGSVVDDLLKGGSRAASVSVTLNNRQDVSVIIASGEDAIWVEFGAGVHHNSSAGTSPHPKGSELGFTIGGYGKGMGRRDTWGYYQDGDLRLTHGTPATMPMYSAVREVCDNLAEIAREVFR